MLKKLNAKASYHEFHAPVLPKIRNHYLDMQNTVYKMKTPDTFDCVLIATDHNNLDYSLLVACKLIIDSRGTMSSKDSNIVRA